MADSANKTKMNTKEAFEGSLEDIIGSFEDRQNQLLSQINKLNLMNLKTNARISKIEKQLETRPSKESSEIESIETSGELEKLKSEVNELEKDLELISEFLLSNDSGEETSKVNEEDKQVVKENRDVEEEIEILNNKVEGVMDRLNTVLNIEDSHSSSNNSSNNQSSQTEGEGLSENAEGVLKKLKELDDVSVDKLVDNTGMSREEIKEAYKELKEKGKV